MMSVRFGLSSGRGEVSRPSELAVVFHCGSMSRAGDVRTFVVLFTRNKQRKHPQWLDGTMTYYESNRKVRPSAFPSSLLLFSSPMSSPQCSSRLSDGSTLLLIPL